MILSKPVVLKNGRVRVKETVNKLSRNYTLNHDFPNQKTAQAWLDKMLGQE